MLLTPDELVDMLGKIGTQQGLTRGQWMACFGANPPFRMALLNNPTISPVNR
jgi:hypothetical protein